MKRDAFDSQETVSSFIKLITCTPLARQIKDVAFYDRKTTVVWWDDGSKTVSVCDDSDEFDKQTGFLMAVLNRYIGGKTKSSILNHLDAFKDE